ncbi:hypothetical protein SRHO_G00232960 [Serrasalmus rhombeus]
MLWDEKRDWDDPFLPGDLFLLCPKETGVYPSLGAMEALTGAQLARVLREELTLPIHNLAFWTDSTTVLNWLQDDYREAKKVLLLRVQHGRFPAELQNLGEDVIPYICCLPLGKEPAV